MKQTKSGKNYTQFLLLTSALVLSLFSCRPARFVEKGEEQLLNKVEVDLVGSKTIDADDILDHVRQKPNRKMAIFRFHLWVWNSTHKQWVKTPKKNGKERLRHKLNHVIGEAPVINDTNLVNKSEEQIKFYLENEGYYKSQIETEYKTKRFNKKKVKVLYHINTGTPTIIKDIQYDIPQLQIEKYVKRDTLSSKLKRGEIFRLDDLKAERKRINAEMNRIGYYFFNEEFIKFTADTNDLNNEVVLTLAVLHPPQIAGDTITKVRHQRYKINKLIVQPDYSTAQKNKIPYNSEVFQDVIFQSNGDYKVDKELLLRNIFIEQDQYYDFVDVDQTYASLSNLGIFSLINISFEPYQDSGKYYLDAKIQLAPIPQHSVAFETEGTLTSGNPGIGGSFTYMNRNTFGGAERFTASVSGGSEVQFSSYIPELIDGIVNTREFGPELSLRFPSFWFPKKLVGEVSKKSMPKTTLKLSYNFEERAEYRRNLGMMSLGYEWNETEEKRHTIKPIDISISRFDEGSPILLYADTSNNVFIKNSFRNFLNVGSKYSFVYSSNKKKSKFQHYFRSDLELVGNMLSLLNKTSLMTTDGEFYYLWGIRYAHFVRTHFDFREYFKLNEENRIAYKFELGLAFPIANNSTLPFDRSFFAGGSNSLRAWTNRTMGPGAFYQDPNNPITQLGDLKVETNLEYRFNLNSWIEGALFVDAGNIWLFKKNDDVPLGHFAWDRFYKEIAVGGGTGLRFDFSFLIGRLDWGIPFYSPGRQYNELTDSYDIPDISFMNKLQNSRVSFGIGYPF